MNLYGNFGKKIMNNYLKKIKINIALKCLFCLVIIGCNENAKKINLDCQIQEDLCIANLETLNLPNNFDNPEYRKRNFNIKNETVKIASFSQNKQIINFEIYTHVITFSEFIPLGKVINDTLYVSVLENLNKKNEKYDMSVLKLNYVYNLSKTEKIKYIYFVVEKSDKYKKLWGARSSTKR